MKIYATMASERAKKGQGGNRELAIKIGIGNKHFPLDILSVLVKRDGEDYKLSVVSGHTVVFKKTFTYHESKGKKQKSETVGIDICPDCMKSQQDSDKQCEDWAYEYLRQNGKCKYCNNDE